MREWVQWIVVMRIEKKAEEEEEEERKEKTNKQTETETESQTAKRGSEVNRVNEGMLLLLVGPSSLIFRLLSLFPAHSALALCTRTLHSC